MGVEKIMVMDGDDLRWWWTADLKAGRKNEIEEDVEVDSVGGKKRG